MESQESTQYCSACGVALPSGAAFCAACGVATGARPVAEQPQTFCLNCGHALLPHQTICPVCQTPRPERQVTLLVAAGHEVVQLVGIVGALLLLVGAFVPIARAPDVGNLNLPFYEWMPTLLVVAGAIVAGVFALLHRTDAVAMAGAASIGLVWFAYRRLEDELDTRGIIETTRNAGRVGTTMDTQWGMAIVIIGILLLLLAGLLGRIVRRTTGPDGGG